MDGFLVYCTPCDMQLQMNYESPNRKLHHGMVPDFTWPCMSRTSATFQTFERQLSS